MSVLLKNQHQVFDVLLGRTLTLSPALGTATAVAAQIWSDGASGFSQVAMGATPVTIGPLAANAKIIVVATGAVQVDDGAPAPVVTTDPQPTNFSTAIQLDISRGRDMGLHLVTSNEVYTTAPGAIDNGACIVTLVGDGVHTPDFSAFENPNQFVFGNTRKNELAFLSRGGATYLFGALGPFVDTTLPTLVSAVVSNSTPGRIDLTWSEAMSSDIAAFSAFAVSAGPHPLTAHTYVDALHTFLTTSTPFAPAEARTLAYTQPGSSKMRDIAGNLLANFSGVAITDNVAAAASLAVSSGTAWGNFTVSTLTGLDEYVIFGAPITDQAGSKRVALIPNDANAAPYGGATFANPLGTATISWTDATQASNPANQPAGNNNSSCSAYGIPGVGEAGVRLFVNVDGAVRKVRVYLRAVDFSGNHGIQVRGTLGDASAAPVVSGPFNTGDTNVYFEFTVNAASSTTLQVDVFPTTLVAGAQIGVVGVVVLH